MKLPNVRYTRKKSYMHVNVVTQKKSVTHFVTKLSGLIPKHSIHSGKLATNQTDRVSMVV